MSESNAPPEWALAELEVLYRIHSSRQVHDRDLVGDWPADPQVLAELVRLIGSAGRSAEIRDAALNTPT